MIYLLPQTLPVARPAYGSSARLPAPLGRPERTAQSLIATTASSESEFMLRVQTDEGDLVTISFHREEDTAYVGYGSRYRTAGGNQRFRAQAASASVSQDLEIRIDGELSEEERKDVWKLARMLTPILRSFLQGKDRSRTANGPALPSFAAQAVDSLAGFRLDLERSVELSLLAAQSASESRAVHLEQLTVSRSPADPDPEDLLGTMLATARALIPSTRGMPGLLRILKASLALAFRELERETQSGVPSSETETVQEAVDLSRR